MLRFGYAVLALFGFASPVWLLMALTPPAVASPRPLPMARLQQGQTSMTQGLDHLKACRRGQFLMPMLPGMGARMTIRGRQGDRCLVDYHMVSQFEWTPELLYGRCQYRPQTVALMTDKTAYDQARKFEQTGTLTIEFSTSNPRDRALSNAMSRDCQFFEPKP